MVNVGKSGGFSDNVRSFSDQVMFYSKGKLIYAVSACTQKNK